MLLTLSLLAVAGLLLSVVGLGRMAWRILSGEEEFEPGGSYSRQAVGRDHEDRKPARRGRLARLVGRG